MWGEQELEKLLLHGDEEQIAALFSSHTLVCDSDCFARAVASVAPKLEEEQKERYASFLWLSRWCLTQEKVRQSVFGLDEEERSTNGDLDPTRTCGGTQEL